MVKSKKRILIDLDVITVRLWDKKGKNKAIAERFIQRVENKEFFVVTPFFLIELVLKWKYRELKENIKEFYIQNSNKLLSDIEFKEKSNELNIDTDKLVNLLESNDVKAEDSILVLVTSMFELDSLVTFNRKHLKNKKEVINKILKENGLRTIKILLPNEL